jgi:hypothetical protein
MKKTTLYLPPELQRTYRELARRTGRSQAVLMREALQCYADVQEPPRLRSLGIARNVSLQSVDVEDWLKANWHPDAEWRSEPDPYPE